MSPLSPLTTIETIVAEQIKTKAALAETEAPDFFPLDFLDARERGLSRIIAWLLNSDGSHAQSTRFLGSSGPPLSVTSSSAALLMKGRNVMQ